MDFHGIENVDDYPIRIVIADGEEVSGIDRYNIPHCILKVPN